MGNYGGDQRAQSVRYLIVVAVLLIWPLRALAAIDAHSEVAAALYAASATHDAAERLADARLRAQRQEIEGLRAAETSGRTAQDERDRAVASVALADVPQAQGDGPGALAAYRRSLAIDETLAARDASNAEWQRDLLVSYVRLSVASGERRLTAGDSWQAAQRRHAVRFRRRSGV